MYKNIINSINRWILSTNHKDISTLLNLFFAGFSGIIGILYSVFFNPVLLLAQENPEIYNKFQELHMGQVSYINFDIQYAIDQDGINISDDKITSHILQHHQSWDPMIIDDVKDIAEDLFYNNAGRIRNSISHRYVPNKELLASNEIEINKKFISLDLLSDNYLIISNNNSLSITCEKKFFIYLKNILKRQSSFEDYAYLEYNSIYYNNGINDFLIKKKNFIESQVKLLNPYSREKIILNKIKLGVLFILNVLAPNTVSFLDSVFGFNKRFNTGLPNPNYTKILNYIEKNVNSLCKFCFGIKKKNNILKCEVRTQDLIELIPSHFYNNILILFKEGLFDSKNNKLFNYLNIGFYENSFINNYNAECINFFNQNFINFYTIKYKNEINLNCFDTILLNEQKRIIIFKNIYELLTELNFQRNLIDNFVDKDINLEKKNIYMNKLISHINQKINKIVNLISLYYHDTYFLQLNSKHFIAETIKELEKNNSSSSSSSSSSNSY